MSLKVAVTYGNLDDLNARKVLPYTLALQEAGLDPICVTPQEPKGLAGFHGLLLTGGADINPALYGQAFNGSEGVDDQRDSLEAELLQRALDDDLPVLAICRGAQLLNVVHGGTLIQHLPSSDVHLRKCPGCTRGSHPAAHDIQVEPHSRLAGIISPGAHQVNSRHHQAAGDVGAGLAVSAISTDGVKEGLERRDRTFVVGVQWHPEDRVLVSAADRKLFESFAAAVSFRGPQVQP